MVHEKSRYLFRRSINDSESFDTMPDNLMYKILFSIFSFCFFFEENEKETTKAPNEVFGVVRKSDSYSIFFFT